MARRAGKAASRRARQQRRAQRPMSPPSAAAAPPAEDVASEDRADESREEPRRASAPIASAPPSLARAYATGGSSLTVRERAEYHYVERDLRNIGILTAILFALLIAAWFVVSAIRGFG